ncbi:MAG: DUF1566 domain-containing protein [Bacteroidales bacterium]|nr:DUF1566 domain-containing protein [Bacteroidales bacterium]
MKRIIILSIAIVCLVLVGCKKKKDETVSPGSIYGSVSDKATSELIAGAEVELLPLGLKTVTGSDGYFQFVQIDPGVYNLLIKKTGYEDLKTEAINVSSGQQSKRDEKLQKLPTSLYITDNDGNELSELDFGGDAGVVSKTFIIRNRGSESFTFNIEDPDADWIERISPTNGTVPVNGGCPVVVKIGRDLLLNGVNRTSIIITSPAIGGIEFRIKARKTESGYYVELPAARLFVQIEDLGRVNWNTAQTLCASSTVGDFNNWRLPTKEELGTLYTNRELIGAFTTGKYWSSDNESGSNYYCESFSNGAIGVCHKDSLLYVRAVISFSETVPNISTATPTNITTTSAETGGTIVYSGVSEITARGVCWGTSHNPSLEGNHTEDGSGIGTFISHLTNLEINTTYYVRAYAVNEEGVYYGDEKTFATNDGSIIVTTNNISNITSTTAVCGGNITVPSGNTFPVTARGVCWGITHNPTTNDSHTSDGTGAGTFTSTITGLTINTSYYVRAYAVNEMGIFYGEEKNFNTTMGLASVITKEVSAIAPLSAVCGGNVTSDNGYTVTARGICWGLVPNPTTNDNNIPNGAGIGEFNSLIDNLQNSTTYHVRAYAINENGTAYGDDKTFITTSGAISVTTNNVSDIGPTSATCGGNATISNDNNLPIMGKGICWSTSHNPTIEGYHTEDGSGVGPFVSSITGLTISTTYYVRAYATNQLGVYYGDEKTFITTDGLPRVNTIEPTMNNMVVTSGGNVVSDGGYPVTARGICYSTTPYPDLSSSHSHTDDGAGTGTFSSTFTMSGVGVYYIRAYATNSMGTYYGEQKTINHPYNDLPTFTFGGQTYRIAPEAPTTMTWDNANSYCNNLILYGYSDWRLPTGNELSAAFYSIGNVLSGIVWSSNPCNDGTAYPNWGHVTYQHSAMPGGSGYDCHTDDDVLYVRPFRIEN